MAAGQDKLSKEQIGAINHAIHRWRYCSNAERTTQGISQFLPIILSRNLSTVEWQHVGVYNLYLTDVPDVSNNGCQSCDNCPVKF